VLENIKKLVEADDYRLTIHALERCAERDISPQEVREVLLSGEIIENYPQDKFGQSCLVCGRTKTDRILHVQCSVYPVWVITAYDPTLNPERWDESFERRITS
jgi:hypothetical protein